MKNLFRRPCDLTLSLLFLVSICLPTVSLLLGVDVAPNLSENRLLAAMPNLRSPAWAVVQDPARLRAWVAMARAISDWPRSFEAYYNDHFGFRRLLVRAHSRLVLLDWPARGDVIVGRGGWLYLGMASVRESYQASSPFSGRELETWRSELERRRNWLAARGIDYLVVVTPEKSTIYPEMMPRTVPRLGAQTRLDQLVAYLAAHSDLQVVDLRKALLDARSQHETYYRTDSHWNGWGAFVASQQIAANLSLRHPGLGPKAETAYEFQERDILGGDLAGLLALRDLFRDQAVVELPVSPALAREADTGIDPALVRNPAEAPQAREIPGSNAPTAVVFRDSFGTGLVPFLSEHFRRSLYLWQHRLDEETILREHPTIVIQEFAERELQLAPPLGGD